MRAGLTVERSAESGLAPLAIRPLLSLAGAVVVLLLAVAGRYGYSGEELFLLGAGRHPALAYLDRPPLLPLLTRLLDTASGGSLVGLRVPAALLTAAGVLVTALIARELGGGRHAQLLAAAVFAGAAFPLRAGHLMTAAVVGLLLWAVCTWLLVRWVRTRDDRLLLWLGLVTALALQASYLIAAFWLVVVITVLTVGPRELGSRPMLWAGGGLAAIGLVPAVVWQARNGWPLLIPAATPDQSALSGTVTFLPLVLAGAGLLAGAVGVCYGVTRLLTSPDLRPYAFLGWTAIGVTALFLATDGRPQFVAGMFPVAWAAAAVEVEREAPPRCWRWLASWPVIGLSVLLALPGLPVAPLSWLSHDRPLSAANPLVNEVGWPELADSVAGVYRELPAAERADTVIVAGDYRIAAALDRFGPALGLPRAYSPRHAYWYFGGPPDDAGTVLYLGDPAVPRPYFGRLARIGTVGGPAAGVPAGTPIWLATERRGSWTQLWPVLRSR